MKFFQSAAVIALLLDSSASVNAVQIRSERQELMQQYSSMKDDELLNKVNDSLKNPPKLAQNKDDAVKTAEELKVIEEAMAKRVMDRITGAPQYGHNYGPYGSGDVPYPLPAASPYTYPGNPYSYGYPGYPYAYPLGGYGVGDGVGALKAYHDLILGYEAQNAIAGMVHPSMDVVKAALDAATIVKAAEPAKTEAPKNSTLLEESVVLQVNGSPITVNPETLLRSNTEAATSLGLIDIAVGLDELSVAQKKQLKGPEQGLELDTMAKRLAQINNKISKDHTFLQTLPDDPRDGINAVNGGDAVTGLTYNEDLGEDSRVGADAVHYAKKHHHHAQTRTLPDDPRDGVKAVNGGDAVTGLTYNEDLGEDSRVGADAVHYAKRHHHAQTRTLPDEPYTTAGGNVVTNGVDSVTGMVGDEDLGEDIRVGPDNVHFIRQHRRNQQNKHHHNHVQHRTHHRTLPDTPYTNAGGNKATFQGDAVEGMVGNEDLGEDARVGADNVHYRRNRQ